MRAAALLALLLLGGCGTKTVHERPEGPAPGKLHDSAVAKIDSEVETIALARVDGTAYDAEIGKLNGKVVLVDFWATWCGPCVEQLPHTLELGRRLSERGLAVVTVSCDDPSESENVKMFLASKNAGVATNLISEFGGSPKSMDVFDIDTGAVPFYKLYDRAGKLRQNFGIDPRAKTQFTAADIDAAVEQLLAEKTAGN